ncbi:MAG TPA: lipoprotein-releasing ABC transporter permease subunit [Acidiferrobacterales bacterium]
MIRPYELYVGLRYTRAKRRNHFISFISLISIVGIALGVTVLITVLSVMNGFGEELRVRILGVVSHLTVSGPGGQLADWRAAAGTVERHPDVLATAPYIQGQGMLTRGKIASGIVVRGILPETEPRVAEIDRKMESGAFGDLKPGGFGIILGRELAWRLGVEVGDAVTLVTPEGQITPAGLLPRLKRFNVVGIFNIGMHEFDSGLALIHLDDAQRLYQMPERVSGLRVKLADVYRAPRVGWELREAMNDEFRVRDWTQEHSNFFRALKMEKTVMFVIMLLIVTVAAFNIVSTLVMVVTDKRAEIAILRTLGARPGSIMGIFMVQGSIIGIFGTLLGALGGIGLATNLETIVPFLERLFKTQFLSADVYYISELPSRLLWSDVTVISGASLLMCFLATLYPARRAALTQPAEALRYE